MDSRSGVLSPPDRPANPRGCQAPSDKANSCHTPPVSSVILASREGARSHVEPPHAECGGTLTSTRLGSPCGSSVNRTACEREACLPSSPVLLLTALSCEGTGPNDIIVNDVSGGPSVDSTSGNPCGRSAQDNAPDRYDSRHDQCSKPPGALSPGCVPPLDDSLLVESGGLRQCTPPGDPCDPSVRTSRPPGLSSPGLLAPTGCYTPATTVANGRPPETLSPGCLLHPGNIMNDVSGVFPQTPVLDGPCDRSVLGDGLRPLLPYVPTSNFLEFASTPDILPQQVVGQLLAVEASTPPFHPTRLMTPSSPPTHATAYASGVKATPIHGDGSGITNSHAEGTTFLPPGPSGESAHCVANHRSAPHYNHSLTYTDGSLVPTSSPRTATDQSVNAMVANQLRRLDGSNTSPESHAELAVIDFPGQFLHLQTTGVGAQVRGLVTHAARWIEDLRHCFPPDCDKIPAMGTVARLIAERTQAHQQEHAKVAMSVHLRDEKRKLELELAVVAEGYLRGIGFSPTDLCDLTRRVKILKLQEGGWWVRLQGQLDHFFQNWRDVAAH